MYIYIYIIYIYIYNIHIYIYTYMARHPATPGCMWYISSGNS